MGRRQITGESMRLLNRNLPAFGTLFGLILVLGACGNSPEELGTEGYVQGFIGGVAADEPRAVLEGQKIH